MPKVIPLLMLTAIALFWPGCTPTPPPGDVLPPRPIVVATPTPGAAQLRVTRAVTQSITPLPTANTALTLTAPVSLPLAVPPASILCQFTPDNVPPIYGHDVPFLNVPPLSRHCTLTIV